MVTQKDFALVALLPEMYGILHGKPTWSVLRSAYFKSRLSPAMEDLDPARDGCGLMWLALAVPMSGSHAISVLDLAERLFTSFGLNMSACFTMMNERTMFFLLGLFFDQENNAERNRAAQLYQALHETFSKHGYQHYRSGIPAWAIDRGSGSTVATLLEQLKAAVDPAGILAPGRYHISRDTYR
jgi:4-cresol dehydrogenase (hydroxylating) flavoprotein subunit